MCGYRWISGVVYCVKHHFADVLKLLRRQFFWQAMVEHLFNLVWPTFVKLVVWTPFVFHLLHWGSTTSELIYSDQIIVYYKKCIPPHDICTSVFMLICGLTNFMYNVQNTGKNCKIVRTADQDPCFPAPTSARSSEILSRAFFHLSVRHARMTLWTWKPKQQKVDCSRLSRYTA